VATGLAVPLYAFPVLRLGGRAVDLATILAALFVGVFSIPRIFRQPAPTRSHIAFLAAALCVPLLVLVPPRPGGFAARLFVVSYLHWALLVLFFFGALSLELSATDRGRLLAACVVLGVLVALFALYQTVGISRGWPATGERVVSFQRSRFRLAPIGTYVRPTSVFLEPAWMGGYLAGALAFTLALWASPHRSRRDEAALVAAGAVLASAILTSVSWGAFADALAVVVVAVLARRSAPRPRRRRAVVALAGVLMAGALLLTPPVWTAGRAVLARWQMLMTTPLQAPEASVYIQDSSWVRLQNFLHARERWREHPVAGVGLGQLGRFAPWGPGSDQGQLAEGRPWCGWVAIAAEAGSLGPFLLVWAIGLAAVRWKSGAAEGLGGVVLALAVLAAVQQLHTGSYIDLWWWFPLSLGAVLGAPSR
jgi:hypothetical protein